MLPLIAQRNVLIAQELREPVAAYLGNAYPLLLSAQRAELDQALLTVESAEGNEDLVRYRSDLLAAYARAIPPEVETALADRRITRKPKADRLADHVADHDQDNAAADGHDDGEEQEGDNESEDDELILGGSAMHAFTVSEPAFSEDIAEAGGTEELQAAVEAASAYIHINVIGDLAELPSTIRRITAAATGAEPVVVAHVLDVTAELVRVGLEREALSDADVTEFAPIVYNAAAVRPVAIDPDEDDDALRWSCPAASIAAARSLPRLFRRSGDDRAAETLIALTAHPRAAVRRHALFGMKALAETRLEDVWRSVEAAANAQHSGIAYTASLLFDWLAQFDQERARNGNLSAYDRVRFATKRIHA
jgi:hypothetical protein